MQRLAVLKMIRQMHCYDYALVRPSAHAVPELSYSERKFWVCMHVLICSIGNSTSRANSNHSGRLDIKVV